MNVKWKAIAGRETQVRAARFFVVGGTSFAVQVAVMKVASGMLGLGTNTAFTVAFVCSTLTHYLLNRFWALPSARVDTWRQAKEYLGTAAISWVINFAVFRLCLDVIGLGKVWATAVAVPPSTVVVFLLLNFRVFRAGEVAEGEPRNTRKTREDGEARDRESGDAHLR